MLKAHTINTLVSLKPLIADYLDELLLSKRSNPNYVIASMKAGIVGHTAMVFSEDTIHPTLFVWGLVQNSAVLNEKLFVAAVVFIARDQRGNAATVREIMDTIDIAARFHGCASIYGGEWKANPKAARMWGKSGFTEQESFWVKAL